MEKEMATHFSTLAWKISWTEEPGRLQSMGSQRDGHDWETSLSFFTFMHWRRKWQPTPVFLPWESQGRGAWWTAIYGVAQSQTRLKRLSSSSTSYVQTVVCFHIILCYNCFILVDIDTLHLYLLRGWVHLSTKRLGTSWGNYYFLSRT